MNKNIADVIKEKCKKITEWMNIKREFKNEIPIKDISLSYNLAYSVNNLINMAELIIKMSDNRNVKVLRADDPSNAMLQLVVYYENSDGSENAVLLSLPISFLKSQDGDDLKRLEDWYKERRNIEDYKKAYPLFNEFANFGG